MLVILEGPDGAGKSTLAQELAAYLGRTTSDKVEVWHRGPPERHPIDEYLTSLVDYRPGAGHHLILDRWHWGEYVYPKVTGRRSNLNDAAWWAIEAYLRRLGALVVHCERETRQEYVDVYRSRALDCTPDSWQLDNLDRVRLEFARAGYRSQLPTWMHTPHADPPYVTALVGAAREVEERYRVLNRFVTYLGPLRPEALLLGDVRNIVPKLDPANHLPAFVPFESSSGLYLLRALTSLPARDWPRLVGVANACDVDDVRDLWRALGQPAVVALGANAALQLVKLGLTHGVVPHPQFVRRFHHDRHTDYGWLIHMASRTGEDFRRWPRSFTVAADATSTPTS